MSIVVHVAITGMSCVDKKIHVLHVVDKRGNSSLPQITVLLKEGEIDDEAIQNRIKQYVAGYFNISDTIFSIDNKFILRLPDDSMLVNMPYSSPNNVRMIGGSKSSTEWLDRMNARCAAVHDEGGTTCLEYIMTPDDTYMACAIIPVVTLMLLYSLRLWPLWYVLMLLASGLGVTSLAQGLKSTPTAHDTLSRVFIRYHDIHKLQWVQLAADSPDIDEPDATTVPHSMHRVRLQRRPVRDDQENEENEGEREEEEEEHSSKFIVTKYKWDSFSTWLKIPFRTFLALISNFNAVCAVPART
jgi:hypothetical protein